MSSGSKYGGVKGGGVKGGGGGGGKGGGGKGGGGKDGGGKGGGGKDGGGKGGGGKGGGGKGGGGKGGKGGCSDGDVAVLLTNDVYATVKAAIDAATQIDTVAGPAMRVCLDCTTLNNLLGSVGLAFSLNCKKKKSKGGKKGGK